MRNVIAVLFFIVPIVAARCAEPISVAQERPIVLPKFVVTDTRILPPPESWHYAEIPGFEVLSNISARKTKRFVRDFLLLQTVVDIIMPGLRGGQAAMPVSLILAGRGDGFDRFLPAERRDDRDRTNSLFFADQERAVIVVDFALDELRLDDNTFSESDPYRGFYKEYFRYIIRRRIGPQAPVWFEEGLVQLFASIDFTNKWINFALITDRFGGKVRDIDGGEVDDEVDDEVGGEVGGERSGNSTRSLLDRRLLSLAELFAETPVSRRDAAWSAQAYAFVHLCLYGKKQQYLKPLVQFVGRLSHEPPSEALFMECFKQSYKDVGKDLWEHIHGATHYKTVQYTAKKGHSLQEPPPFELRDAPDAVVGRITGETFRLGGHAEAAHNALIAPYIRGEREPRLLAALGLDERRAGRDGRARKFLEAAASANVDRPRAYLELARLRYMEALAQPAVGDGKLDAQRIADVLAPLFQARELRPPMKEVYLLIAETLSRSAVSPRREHVEVVLEGVLLFQRDPHLLLLAASLATDCGMTAEARDVAEWGMKIATDPADIDRFKVLAAAVARDAGENGAKKTPIR